jgi:hypothetical protein
MGYYINPENETKEAWLKANAKSITEEEALGFDFTRDRLPVCLVDNGIFTAVGIAFDHRERDVFAQHDGRPKRWFSASRVSLRPWYK